MTPQSLYLVDSSNAYVWHVLWLCNLRSSCWMNLPPAWTRFPPEKSKPRCRNSRRNTRSSSCLTRFNKPDAPPITPHSSCKGNLSSTGRGNRSLPRPNKNGRKITSPAGLDKLHRAERRVERQRNLKTKRG